MVICGLYNFKFYVNIVNLGQTDMFTTNLKSKYFLMFANAETAFLGFS